VIRAPVAGQVVDLAVVPDVVFAGQLVGPGVAVQPAGDVVRVCAPVAGRIAVLHPQAVVVLAAGGRAVLVHLGIDTARLAGRGFAVHVAQDQQVEAGDLLVQWDPVAARVASATAGLTIPASLVGYGLGPAGPAALSRGGVPRESARNVLQADADPGVHGRAAASGMMRHAGVDQEISTVCPVIALQADDAAVTLLQTPGTDVQIGDPLFEWLAV
jgi:PTS system N-acetylglucosamine-specific IIA component